MNVHEREFPIYVRAGLLNGALYNVRIAVCDSIDREERIGQAPEGTTLAPSGSSFKTQT